MQALIDAGWKWVADNSAWILALLGSPIVLALWERGAGLFRLRKVHVVRRADDPAIVAIERIQRAVFPPQELDPEGLLASKIAASRFSMFGKPRAQSMMVLIYYKHGGKIHGYLSAEYFLKTRTIFFWYLVNMEAWKGPVPRKLAEEEASESDAAGGMPGRLELPDFNGPDTPRAEVSVKLLEQLSKICNSVNGKWNQIIAEVDAADTYGAILRLRRFQGYAQKANTQRRERPLAFLFNPGEVKVFKVETPFKMPLHESGFLFEANKHETPAWLVFAPQRLDGIEKIGGAYFLDGSRLQDLLTSLALSYRDEEDRDYSAYIDRFYDQLRAVVPEKVPLVSEGSRLYGAERKPVASANVATAAR